MRGVIHMRSTATLVYPEIRQTDGQERSRQFACKRSMLPRSFRCGSIGASTPDSVSQSGLGRCSGDGRVVESRVPVAQRSCSHHARASVPAGSESASALALVCHASIPAMLTTAWVCRSCLSRITRPLIKQQLRHQSSGMISIVLSLVGSYTRGSCL